MLSSFDRLRVPFLPRLSEFHQLLASFTEFFSDYRVLPRFIQVFFSTVTAIEFSYDSGPVSPNFTELN